MNASFLDQDIIVCDIFCLLPLQLAALEHDVFLSSSVCPVPNIFLSLSKMLERISIKFVGGNRYYEQIKAQSLSNRCSCRELHGDGGQR